MKRIVICLLLFLASCAVPQYQWSSEQGRQCFYMCKTNYNACEANHNSTCNNTQSGIVAVMCLFTINACSNEQDACLKSCPDLKRINGGEPPPPRNTPSTSYRSSSRSSLLIGAGGGVIGSVVTKFLDKTNSSP